MFLGLPQPIIGKSRRPPFSLSGTFASDSDGFVLTDMSRVTFSTRTPPGAIRSDSNPNRAEYTVPANVAGGLTIQFSIWHTNDIGVNRYRAIAYRIGSGSETILDSVTDSSSTYAQMSGSFNNPTDESVTLIFFADLQNGAGVIFDDWAISGA